jgi:hypothetical protein
MDVRHWGTARLQRHFLVKNLLKRETDIALIQEPRFYGDQIRGLRNTKGTPFSAGPSIAPRSCVFLINTVCALPLSELCSTDVAAVRVTYTRGQTKREVTVTSAYLS